MGFKLLIVLCPTITDTKLIALQPTVINNKAGRPTHGHQLGQNSDRDNGSKPLCAGLSAIPDITGERPNQQRAVYRDAKPSGTLNTQTDPP